MRPAEAGGRGARAVLAAALGAALLAGCSLFDDEERLEGTRLPVREALPETTGSAAVERPLPEPVPIEFWSQTGSAASHNGGHIRADLALERIWSVDAGTGSSEDSVVTAAPVVGDGRVFALDAAAGLAAFDAASGEELWQVSLVPNEEEDGEEGFGGGLALDGEGRLFATTGFGEVIALDPASGEILWRRAVGAPFRAGPAAADGAVVAVTRASQAFALEPESGAIRWRVQGVGADAGFLGGASPAIAGGGAVVPFASGELVAIELISGRRFWGAVITGGRRGLARAAITDLTGDPVVVGPLIVAANQSGRLAALEARTGRRVWTRVLGSTRPIWAAGDTLFLVSDNGELIRIDAGSGQTLWQKVLPLFEDPEDREDPIAYSGPVVASGRVLLTDSLGNLWSVDAVTGEGDVAAELGDGAITGPVVAGGILYVLDEEARLHAFR